AAGARRVVELYHRLGKVEQAVGRAGAVRVLCVVLEEEGRRGVRIAPVEVGAAKQVAPEADASVARVPVDVELQLLLRLGIELRLPQAEAVDVFVLAGIAGRWLLDRADRRDTLGARPRR